MKKTFFTALSVCTPFMLGATSVFADSSSTPVTANFTVSNTDNTNPTPPSPAGPTNPDGNNNLNPTTTFAIAYLPSKFNFGDIQLTGNSTINAPAIVSKGNTFNVGVKNTTHTTEGWKLTAALTGDLTNYGATIKTTGNTVKENKSGTLTNLVNAQSITVNSDATISSTPTDMLTGNSGNTFAGTYDLQLGTVSLNIPDTSTVNAGNSTGSVSWNLSKVPTVPVP